MSATAQIISGILLLILITVMFGGFSLLRLGLAGKLTDAQAGQFRAGHAHAGVLTIATLLVVDLLDRAGASGGTLWLIAGAMFVSVLAQSGGFFIGMGNQRTGALVTMIGGTALSITVAVSAIWLLA